MIYNGEWRNPSQQSDVDAAIAIIKAENDALTQTTLTEINDSIKEAVDKAESTVVNESVDIDVPGFVKKKVRKSISAVNKFGMKYPTSIKSSRKDT